MWTLLLACAAPSPETGDDSGSPDVLEPLPVNRACVIEEGSAPDGAATVELELSGRVSEAVFGEPPGGCKDRDEWHGQAEVDWTGTEPVWIRLVDDDGTSWIASATSPWIPAPMPLEGMEVTLRFRSVPAEPFDGVAAETELDLATEGYAFYLGHAGTLDALTPWPEVEVSEGPPEARWTDPCGAGYRATLHGRRGETEADVPTGDTYGFDGIAVANGGVVVPTELGCSETLFGYASVVEWRVE